MLPLQRSDQEDCSMLPADVTIDSYKDLSALWKRPCSLSWQPGRFLLLTCYYVMIPNHDMSHVASSACWSPFVV